MDAQTGILNCQLALGMWNEAHNQAEHILQNFPQNIAVLNKAAYSTYMLQNYRATADYYQRIVNIFPWDMESRGYLVNNHIPFQGYRKCSPALSNLKEICSRFCYGKGIF